MNKSFLKFITDFGPLLIFFTIYYKSGNNLIVAIPPLIIATIVAVAIMYFVEKKIPYVPLIGGVVITLFGGLTLYFNNPIFIYMKPTIVNLIFAGILIISKVFFQRNFLKFFLIPQMNHFHLEIIHKDYNFTILLFYRKTSQVLTSTGAVITKACIWLKYCLMVHALNPIELFVP